MKTIRLPHSGAELREPRMPYLGAGYGDWLQWYLAMRRWRYFQRKQRQARQHEGGSGQRERSTDAG